MPSSRKAFIARAGAASAGALVSASAFAQAAPAPSAPESAPSPKPSPSPTASPSPSPAASEIAASMRRFDSALTDEQVRTIARGIDDQNKYAAMIRKGRPLHNGDEPTPEFSVRP